MKTSENNNFKILKGAGFLIGFISTLVVAIAIFILSNNFVVSISASVPIGITLGISLEQKFQEGISINRTKKSQVMMGLLSVGIIVFLAIFLLVKFI